MIRGKILSGRVGPLRLIAGIVAGLLLVLTLPAVSAQAYWYGPPQNLRTTDLGGGRTQFQWDPPNPANYQGVAPTEYWYTIKGSGYKSYYCDGTGSYSYTINSTSCTVTGIPYGEPVTLTVRAYNPYYSDSAIKAFTLCCELPTAPTSVTASAGDTTGKVSWGAPANAGKAGMEFTYSVEIRPGGAVCTTTDTSCDIGGLTNGVEYTFYVAAKNKTGTSPAASSQPIKPIGPPGPPTGVKGVLLGRGQVEVSWQGPTVTGGAVIDRYVATSSPEGLTCESFGDLQCTMSGLSNGNSYTFTVVAFNAAGQSIASPASPVALILAGPGKPLNVRATRKDRAVTVTWSAPKSTGGTPIRGYTVTASPSGKTCKATKPSGCTISYLPIGATYVFTVQAKNAKAAGLSTSSNAITIPGPPPPPKEVPTFS